MPAVLGISAYYHDAAAALLVDGKLVAAIQEERLSRIKNDPSLPVRAAEACLRLGGLPATALDRVVFYEQPFAKLERVMLQLVRTFPRSWRQFPRALASQLGTKLWVLDQLAEALGVDRKKVECVEHHRSHAASAFYTSPFTDAAVVVVDGVGEHASTSLWHGHGRTLKQLATIDFPHSLGLLYAAITAYLGFAVNEGEYKVMGLAAWGSPRYQDAFAKIVRLHNDGSYELDLRYFAHMTDTQLGFGPALEQLLGPRRPPGLRWDLASDRDRHYADVAASLQVTLERALLGLAHRACELTGATSLCLAGGVALNAVANARLLREAALENMYVHPAAGDAGGAVGAAILASLELGTPLPGPLQSAALGPVIDPARAWDLATSLGLHPRRLDDPATVCAHAIANGKIVAHARGRLEWGPRALGQRSLLADPSDRTTRERINRVIKQREAFRPFAPAIRERDMADYFIGSTNAMTPFMTTVAPIQPSMHEQLAAVTHEDGTARLQTVTPAKAPELAAVLDALTNASRPPVVLNTSLNGPGEPIVASAEDALGFFLRHPVDCMLLGDIWLERAKAP